MCNAYVSCARVRCIYTMTIVYLFPTFVVTRWPNIHSQHYCHSFARTNHCHDILWANVVNRYTIGKNVTSVSVVEMTQICC